MRKLILAIFMLMGAACIAQVNVKSLDSLKRSIENSNKNIQSWQDSFKKNQDSIYKAAIEKAVTKRNNKNILNIEPDEKRTGEKRLQHSHIRIGIGIIFFILLALVLSRKRNKKAIF
jgi:hypothetical protein